MSDAGQGISPGGYLAVLWTLTGVATVLLAGRFVVRSIVLRSFHMDDVCSTLAWFLMVVAIICVTISNPLSYQLTAIVVGESPMPSPTELTDLTIQLRRWNVAGQMLFWTALYCVKMSFMFLYKLVLGAPSIHQRIWYVAVIYIILCYGICLIGVYGQCGDVRYLWTVEQCSTPYVAALDGKLIWVDFFFNVSSDLIVIMLPMPLIWTLSMRTSQKLAVSGICSLALITIAFEVVRTVKLYQESFVLTNLYSYLEFEIAIIVSMLPTYRFLISNSEKNREYRRAFWSRITLRSYQSSHSGYSMHSYDRRSRAGNSSQAIATPTESEEVPPLPETSKDEASPLENEVDGRLNQRSGP